MLCLTVVRTGRESITSFMLLYWNVEKGDFSVKIRDSKKLPCRGVQFFARRRRMPWGNCKKKHNNIVQAAYDVRRDDKA